mmetsp:Transcript_16549/g.29810  ORF Transcript_16549/g.29810 Transcript_16549/m.29810 type:complete len:132 (+) Transcript_16549:47-442(+)
MLDSNEELDDVDSMIEADPDINPTPNSSPWTSLSGVRTRRIQSLDEVLVNIQETLNELRPPKNSRKEIYTAWEFIKGLRQEDISSIVQIIDHLPNSELLKKVKEIETLALRLDMNQRAEFTAGEKMSIIKR